MGKWELPEQEEEVNDPEKEEDTFRAMNRLVYSGTWRTDSAAGEREEEKVNRWGHGS